MEKNKAFYIFRKVAKTYCDAHDIPLSKMWEDAPELIRRNIIMYQREDIRVNVKYFDGQPRITLYSIDNKDIYVSIRNSSEKGKVSVAIGDDPVCERISNDLICLIGLEMKRWDNPKERLYRALFGEEYVLFDKEQ